jgi:hypothetical protein
MVGRPALGREDLRDGIRIARVRAEAIDGFRRERDQLAGGEPFHGL